MKQLILIRIIFLCLVGIIACSDSPYTGPLLTPADVDKYISYTANSKVCLTSHGVSKCVSLRQGNKGLNIHIHPQSIVHTFYYKESIILQVERQGNTSKTEGTAPADDDPNTPSADPNNDAPNNPATDTNDEDTPNTDNPNTPSADPNNDAPNNPATDTNDEDTPNTDNPNTPSADPNNDAPNNPATDTNDEDTSDTNEIPDNVKTHHAPNGWLVRLYYQNGIPANAKPSLEGSGFVILVFDADQNDITDSIEQIAFIGGEDGQGLEFFVPTTGQYITLRVKGLIADHVATFIVNAAGEIISTEGTNTYQLDPL